MFDDKHLIRFLYAQSIIVLIILNVVSVDKIIASTKLPKTEYSPKDFYYISLLSTEAVSGWKEAIVYADSVYNSDYSKRRISSDDEKNNLADIKLALLAIQDHRDALIKKYALQSEVEYYLGITDFIKLANTRSYQSMNLADYRAYKFISTDENKKYFYTFLNCLVKDIETYQTYYTLDLFDAETNRVKTLDYPFVAYKTLNSYHPRSVTSIQQDRYYDVYQRSPSPGESFTWFSDQKPGSCKL